MHRIEPRELVGPRAYFTTFDDRLLEHATFESLRIEAERKLKVLLLTKSAVVCAASHLASPVAYAVLKDNPDLLASGALRPALRSDRPSVTEAVLVAAADGCASDAKAMAEFYEATVSQTVTWDLEDNVEWFRAGVLRELIDPKSVLRRNLPSMNDARANEARHQIAGAPGSLRDVMAVLAEDLPSSDRRALLSFRELLYHMSGARVVNCESTLPQENFIDYGLADLENHETSLSELQVFLKLFLEAVYLSVKGRPLQTDLLDALSFRDVLELRRGAFGIEFTSKYDALTESTIRVLKQDEADHLLLDLDQIMGMREALASRMDEAIGGELKAYAAQKSIDRASKAVLSGAGIAASMLGLLPALASGAAAAGVAASSPSFLVNTYESLGGEEALLGLKRTLGRKKRVAIQALAGLDDGQRAPLVNAVAEVAARVTENISL